MDDQQQARQQTDQEQNQPQEQQQQYDNNNNHHDDDRHRHRHRDRDRERDRDRDRDRERDRDRDRDRDHYSDRDRDRHSDRYSDRDRDRYGGRDREREREKERDRDRSDRGDRHDRDRERDRARDNDDVDEMPPRKYSFTSGWDVRPVGMETLGTEELVQNPQLLSLLPPTAQQTRQARRLYVGNVPQDVNERHLMEFFNTTMHSANATVREGDPILNVEINTEKNFAFMEFRTPEEATACIHFDGISYEGCTLRIRRPKDYAGGSAGPEPSGNLAPNGAGVSGGPAVLAGIAGVGSGMAGVAGGVGGPAGLVLSQAMLAAGAQVPDTPNKVFVGGIPAYFNEQQVQELLITVGVLKHFSLIRDQVTGVSKGYAFCEWMDDETTDKACATLNGIQLGEKTLIVQRSNSAMRVAAHQQMGGIPNMPSLGGIAPHPMNLPNLPFPPNNNTNNNAQNNANVVGDPRTSQVPTHVLLLLNMVTAEDLVDDEEFEDIVADVEEECGKHGKVLGVLIPRPPAVGVGKVLVEFAEIPAALDAQAALDGRKFAARTVRATFYSEEAYRARSV